MPYSGRLGNRRLPGGWRARDGYDGGQPASPRCSRARFPPPITITGKRSLIAAKEPEMLGWRGPYL